LKQQSGNVWSGAPLAQTSDVEPPFQQVASLEATVATIKAVKMKTVGIEIVKFPKEVA
jgi:hypothetical protein